MRRQEFIDGATTWYDLVEFCRNETLDFLEDVYSDEEKDEYINERLNDICEGNTWQDVYRTLDSIPEGYDYYLKDEYDWLEFRGLGDEEPLFYNRKNEILEFCDRYGYFEDDIGEDEDESPFGDDGDVDEFEVDKDVALDDFFASSAEDLDKITAEAAAVETKANADFNKFTQRVTTVGDY